MIFGVHWHKPLHVGMERIAGWARFDWRTRLLGPVTLGVLLVLCNDLHGRIHIASDGEQMWIHAENK